MGFTIGGGTSGKWVDGKPRVTSTPYQFDIAKGHVPGHTQMRIQGTNDDVDNVKEDVWSVGGTYVFPTAGMQMELVSSAVGNEDSGPGGVNAVGTGIRTVELHYLDNTWASQTETIALDGTNVVTTTATNILRINGLHTVTTGTGFKAAGDIDIRHLSNTPIYGRIPIGENNLHQAICTVPLGQSLFIVSWQPGIGHQTGNRYARFELDVTTNDEGELLAGIFHNKDIIDIQDMAIFIPMPLPVKIPEKADVKITVISDSAQSNALTSVSFEGWHEDV